MNLIWNVFRHDINQQEIVIYNIFNHGRFNTDVQKALKDAKDKDEFTDMLKRTLMYYFWSRSEYEVIIAPWVGGRDTIDRKVDIYTQVMNNWHIFVDYIWKHKDS